MVKGLAKKKDTKNVKKAVAKFLVDCTQPTDDKIMDAAGLEKFFIERIKVNNKTGINLFL